MSRSPANRVLLAWLLLAHGGAVSQSTSVDEIDKLLDQGFAAAKTGNYPEMARLGEETIRLSSAAHDQKRLARSWLLAGTASYYQSQTSAALEQLRNADRLALEVQDISIQKDVKRTLAGLLRGLGRFDEALHNFDEWLRLNRGLPKPEPEGSIMLPIGILYRNMGDLDKAEEYFNRARQFARASGDPRLEANILLSLAAIAKDRKRFRESIPMFRTALESAEAAQAKDIQAQIVNAMGDAYTQLHDYDNAVKSLRAAIEIAHAIGYRGLEGQATERLGEVERYRGRYAEAIEWFSRAASFYPEGGDWLRFFLDVHWGLAERALGHKEQALSHYQQAIAGVERLEQFTVPSESERAIPLSENRGLVEEAADLLIDMNRPAGALAMAERGRARAFLDVLNDSKVDLRSTLTEAERAREDALLRTVANQRDNARQLSKSLADLEAFYLNLRRSNPAYAQLRRPDLATAEQIQHDLTAGGTVFLEYMLGGERSLAWAVTKDRIQFAVLPGRNQVQALVTAYRNALTGNVTALTAASSRARQDEQSRKLYQILLTPFADSIRNAPHLLVVADSALAYVPFEALESPDSGESLVERHSVSYSQSASASLALRNMRPDAPAPSKMLLAFGDAAYEDRGHADERGGATWMRIPYSRDEVLGISRFYPANQRVLRFGTDATEARVKREDLRAYRYIHFAVHGWIDENNPARSGLVLSRDPRSSDDGILRMEEIALLHTNADLVTLSACRTGIGRLLQGEGLMALSRAFFYAGAHAVIATLWDVSDPSAAEMMKKLYAQLEKGLPPEEALRQAKLGMLRGSVDLWRDPHHWAAFVILQ